MKTITLGPPGYRYKIYDPGGNGRVAKTLRRGIPYEDEVLEDMLALGLTGVAVDAGANIGNHTLWMSAVCELEVHAFEPVRFPQLCANVDLNGISALVECYNMALGDQSGWTTITGPGQKPVDHVRVETLDSVGLGNVAVIKIDCEGMEEQVLRGGIETIVANRPVIYAEAWDDTYLARHKGILGQLGYTHAKSFRWNQNLWLP